MYYPGTPDPQNANPIDLRAGETFLGGDMTITLSRTRSVRGRIVNRVATEAPSSFTILLVSRFADPSAGKPLRVAPMIQDGSYELSAVPSGSYFLIASGSDSSGRLFGRIPLDVGNSDLENVEIAVSLGNQLSGRVSIDDSESLARIRSVMLRPLNGNPAIPGSPDLIATVVGGAFKFEGVPPGDYLAILVFEGPANLYVKTMRLGSEDVRNGFSLGAATGSQLEFVVGTNGGVVQGAVVNDKQQPVAGASVVLVPEAFLRQRSTAYRVRTTDAAGRFRMDAIAPGDYKLFAWDEIEPGAWEDANFLRTYESRGRALTLREGSVEAVSLSSIPAAAPVYSPCPIGLP
jgi:hypothetical protein